MSLNKNSMILIISIAVVAVAALVGAYTISGGLPEDGVFHELDAIPQGAGSGLDADKLDGLSSEEIIAAASAGGSNIGCDTSNFDESGESEYVSVCWNSEENVILFCSFQQQEGEGITSSSTNRGGCAKLTENAVESEYANSDVRRVFKGGDNWQGGVVKGCAITDSDLGGDAEFGFVCGGTEGIIACDSQMTHEGRLDSIMCINSGWETFRTI